MNDITAFFDFLKYCLGNKGNMSRVIAGMNWHRLYSFASKQALQGLCFDGIERLGEEYREELRQNPIGRDLLMTWMGKAQQISRQNMKVNTVASKLFSMLKKDGLRCCVLKGQGNALMYPNPCSMNNPIYHARLQKWFRRNADLQCSHIVGLPDGAGDIAIPTSAFNVVYQLCHLYHHFFDEGIGMRQIIDYYYVVSMLNVNCEMLTWLPKVLKHLGLWKFAGAVMYVLHEALGLSEEKMIAPMDGRRGKLLLTEILNGGNFGKHFTKYGGFTHQRMKNKKL